MNEAKLAAQYSALDKFREVLDRQVYSASYAYSTTE